MYRQLGVQVLNKYITSDKNVKLLEKKINEVSDNQEDYKKLVLEMINYKRNGLSSKELVKVEESVRMCK